VKWYFHNFCTSHIYSQISKSPYYWTFHALTLLPLTSRRHTQHGTSYQAWCLGFF